MLRAKDILPRAILGTRAIGSSFLKYVVTRNQAVVTLFVGSISGRQKAGVCAPSLCCLRQRRKQHAVHIHAEARCAERLLHSTAPLLPKREHCLQ